MDKIKFISILVLTIIYGFSIQLNSQYNSLTARYYSKSDSSIINVDSSKSNYLSNNSIGIPCNPNSFYAVKQSGSIDEFSLVDSTVTYIATFPKDGGGSIAYCDNLNGGTFSPTFYSSNEPNWNPTFFDGNNWINTSINSSNINCGGNGNFIFYQETSLISRKPPRKINKYDGISLTKVYSTQNHIISVADLAVDNNGNIYFLIAKDSGNIASFISDSIIVLSSSGQIVKELPFIFDCHNAYGAFIINNIYYMGLGPFNQNNPNTLIPIKFMSDTIIVGAPIKMPTTEYYDLASCNQGLPLMASNEFILTGVNIYPNPFTSQTIINFPKELNTHNVTLKITNILGKQIRTIDFIGNQLRLEKCEMKSGIYILQIFYNNKFAGNKKFIIQ